MLDLALAKQFAKLLHPELKEASHLAPVIGNQNSTNEFDYFERWWFIKGRAEFPYWSLLSAAEKSWLGSPTSKIKVGETEITLPRALELALSFRPDVTEKFATHQASGVPDPKALAGWFFAMGIHEHLLTDLISLEMVAQLDRSVKILGAENGPSQSLVPAPTVLMVLVWSMLDANMQKLMDLQNPESRFRYIAWFFANAFEVFRLEKLLANRWKSWLREPILLDNRIDSLPRFAVQAHFLMKPDERPNIQTPEGVKQMNDWFADQTKVNGKWHWLVNKSPPSPALPYPRFDPLQVKQKQAETKKQRPFGLNLIGFAYGELGIGEDLRMAVAACEAADISYRIVNIKPGEEIRQEDMELKDRIEKGKKQPSYAINVFIMPGFDSVSRLLMRHGDFVFNGFYNIGWWPWELSTWPKAWNKAFEIVDEVWGGSEFSYQMYQSSTNKPSSLMPLAVSVERAKTYSRKHFKLPEADYLFLYVFDFNSHLKRKNPQAAIKAFQKAFPLHSEGNTPKTKGTDKDTSVVSDAKVGLVLKVMNTKPNSPDWLEFEKLIAGDERIQVINQTLDREEILGLIQVCDAYVSPHRAEGFGRTLAEAMLFGKPVIATNYSGNAFYMHPQLTLPVKYQLVQLKKGDYHFVEDDDGAVWAEPSIDHMAKQMHAAIDKSQDPAYKKALMQYAKTTFNPARTGQLLKERLEVIRAEVNNQVDNIS
jgi:glycosyltransferase involved in cell wall biosynthesis